MKSFAFILAVVVILNGVYSQEKKQPKLLKTPRIYNAVVKSDEELIPSQTYPAIAPVIRPFYTGIYPYAPIIIPQVQPYYPEEYHHHSAIRTYSGDYKSETPEHYEYSKKLPHPPKPEITGRGPVPVSSSKLGENVNGTDPSADYDYQPSGGDASNFENLMKQNILPQPVNYDDSPSSDGDDSYFPQDINAKNNPSSDFGSFLQPPPISQDTKSIKSDQEVKSKSSPPNRNAPEVISPFLLQNYFNYQPEDPQIPNVPPPPLPVSNNNSGNSTKKKIEYPNAPSSLFSTILK